MESLYSHRSHIVLGFHGCDASLAEKVVLGEVMLNRSNHDYDWLGPGIYFWENNFQRAKQWAEDNVGKSGPSIRKPGVLGAYVDLGFCLDLTDSESLQQLEMAYDALSKSIELTKLTMPVNADPISVKPKDRVIRKLDCAVIQTLHTLRKESGLPLYDSVRGVFWEGEDLYPGAGFKEKNHIQIAILNPNCIKGFFLPREVDEHFAIP